MRISDWSSDVCSSDLGVVGKTLRRQLRLRDFPQRLFHYRQARPAFDAAMAAQNALDVAVEEREAVAPGLGQDRAGGAAADAGPGVQGIEAARQLAAVAFDARSAERRGGKECVRTCRCRRVSDT